MSIFLAFGSNLGCARENINNAIINLEKQGVRVKKVAPAIVTPALMPEGAPKSWDMDFLNTVAEVETKVKPLDLLKIIKNIEEEMGRDMAAERWAPRVIDIDILMYNREEISGNKLTLPHPEIINRSFVLDPLCQLASTAEIERKSVLKFSHELATHKPLVMGILNVTPDSFSDGGKYADETALRETVRAWIDAGVHIFDVGGESTRPNAEFVGIDEEWRRVEMALNIIAEESDGRVRPWVSVDTYKPEVAAKAIERGVDIINDVNGLQDAEMIKLVAESGVQAIAMHSLTVPADKAVVFDEKCDVIAELNAWIERQIAIWDEAGITRDNLIFDAGLGFGKTAEQSWQIIERIDEIDSKGMRMLVAHSRKSFLNTITNKPFAERDAETLGVSKKIARSCDMLRVHAPLMHLKHI